MLDLISVLEIMYFNPPTQVVNDTLNYIRKSIILCVLSQNL
jgi:hypothetical protein